MEQMKPAAPSSERYLRFLLLKVLYLLNLCGSVMDAVGRGLCL